MYYSTATAITAVRVVATADIVAIGTGVKVVQSALLYVVQACILWTCTVDIGLQDVHLCGSVYQKDLHFSCELGL